MDQKELKTSLSQRIIIIVIAILLLGSTILAYLFIVMNGGGSSGSSAENDAKLAEIQEEYQAKIAEAGDRARVLSDKYFDTLLKYKSRVKAYNKSTANSTPLKIEDLKAGKGKELQENDYDYFAYYIGWCPDGEVFDSSFDDFENPTSLSAPLDNTGSNIAGWKEGVIGMKVGGVREVTMNGELAYGETREMCDETNSPLRFVIMAVETDAELAKLYDELNTLYIQYSSLSSGSTAQ